MKASMLATNDNMNPQVKQELMDIRSCIATSKGVRMDISY